MKLFLFWEEWIELTWRQRLFIETFIDVNMCIWFPGIVPLFDTVKENLGCSMNVINNHNVYVRVKADRKG